MQKDERNQRRTPAWVVTTATILLAAASWTTTRAGDCEPPPNETCDGEIVFSNDDLPLSLTAPLGCENDIIDRPYFDVFYRFDCNCTGDYTVGMCDSSGDTFLRIYTGACGWNGGSEFAVADDECPGSPPNADPLITVTLEAGTTYWFELGTWRPDPPWAPPLNSPYSFRVSKCDCPPPAITTQPMDQDVCYGDTVMLTAAAQGAPPFTYQWRRNSQDLPGETGDTMILESVGPEDIADYLVVIGDACGETVSAIAEVELIDPGDMDRDGDVGASDFAAFLACVSGPDNLAGDECGCADADADGDIDFADFWRIQRGFTGE